MLSIKKNYKNYSIDCFDTILFRYHGSPKEFYEYLEKIFELPNFAINRQKVIYQCVYRNGNINVTLKDIYKSLGNIYRWNEDQMNFFLFLEKQLDDANLYVVEKSKKWLENNEVTIISDTHYTWNELNNILTKRNIKLPLVTSSCGKAMGTVWNFKNDNITKKSFHIGDNIWSDNIVPFFFGKKTFWFRETKRTFVERLLKENGFPQLSNWIRYIRLTNPYIDKIENSELLLMEDQFQYNLPILIWTCMKIIIFCKKNNLHRILFFTRDCCLLEKIFYRLYFQYIRTNENDDKDKLEVVHFHSSRIAFNNPSEAYKKYFHQCFKQNDTLFVDLNGTGRSLHCFMEKWYPNQKYYSFIGMWWKLYKVISKHNIQPNDCLLIVGVKSTMRSLISMLNYKKNSPTIKLEILNFDITGTLIDFKDYIMDDEKKSFVSGGPVRKPLEYDKWPIIRNHQAIDYALEHLRPNCIDNNLPSEDLLMEIYNHYKPFHTTYWIDHDDNSKKMIKYIYKTITRKL